MKNGSLYVYKGTKFKVGLSCVMYTVHFVLDFE
jgi:hypothetical protein